LKNHVAKSYAEPHKKTSPTVEQPVKGQEAQLAQRDRATLRVIENFAKSLNVTQGHST